MEGNAEQDQPLPGFEGLGAELADRPSDLRDAAAPDLATAEDRVAFPAWRVTPAPDADDARHTRALPGSRVGTGRASFARRAAALLLDLVLLGGAEVVLAWIATLAVDAAAALGGAPIAAGEDLAATLASVGSFLLPVCYFTALHAEGGQTLGKALLGIRVARPDGAPIGVGRSLLRWFGYTLSSIPLGLGYLPALGPSRRALHDFVAGTVVLEVSPERGVRA